jgi:hypothetical protein
VPWEHVFELPALLLDDDVREQVIHSDTASFDFGIAVANAASVATRTARSNFCC